MNFSILVNPKAGNGLPLKVLPLVKNFLSKKKVSFDVTISSQINEVKNFVEKSLKMGAKRFVCLGGDGTLNELLQYVIEKDDITLSILPVGSGNDMARILGFSSVFMESEIEKLLEGEERFIDIGICNGRYFSNAVGIGFDARVAFDYNKSIFLRGKAKYLFQIFKNIVFYKSENMEIEGHFPLQKVFLISIGNGKTTGGGVPLTPEAKIDDGLFDICIIRETGILQRVQNLSKGLKGKHLSLPFVKYFQADSLNIKAEKEMIAHIDGEIFKANSFNISILPKKTKFLFSSLKK